MNLKYRIIVIICLLLAPFCSCSVLSSMMVYTVTLSKNAPLPQQITQANTTYIIKQDFDLRGTTLNIPAGCTLKFDGGSLRNGNLKGNGTVVALDNDHPALDDVILSGSFSAKSFPINAYKTNKLDYFYGFLEAFSGTELYLTGDYSVTEYLGQSDGATPQRLYIDGKGHRLTLYSFGAYKVDDGCMKDITIEATNNITPKNKWKSDKFNFGIVGSSERSSLSLQNVTFVKATGYAYIRGFKNLEIKNCKEDGSYFFVYDCDNVNFSNNEIVNAANGYYSIGRMTEKGQVKIYDNVFSNISGGGAILSGGLKYNVSICDNVFDHVGGGEAMKSCINIHPRGTIFISGNRIVANKGASSLDIDAARSEYYSDGTTVTVRDNVIENVPGDESVHGMALVGLSKLYVKNNTIYNQKFYFWDTPYMEFTGNTVTFTSDLGSSAEIGSMSTHETTEKKDYQHIYKNNVYNLPASKGAAHIRYQSKAPVKVIGKGNTYSNSVDFVDQYKKIKSTGDIKIYK